MRIELLTIEGCPNVEPTLARLWSVAAELGVRAEIHVVTVRDAEEAERLRFPGSPTVRVDGVDLEAEAAARTDYALGCRIYGRSGVPPRELLAAALRAAGSEP